ncbi:hypothetical protein ATEIFO6365_0005057400 [Aspergillus terreus]|uniref:Uncharacterized protein n=1 Tax=Aspergillus terreus TaxID=33178 RepID=A0A5M3Z6B7_ASPTE|nr:hypothetical protein ATETN484_0008009500 [Aspergillus terreus]GFF16384.1 hypothetical protein ATEIFO6365_0005057400 [Aspergillus terreus]
MSQPLKTLLQLDPGTDSSRPDPKDAHEAAGNHEINPVDLLPSDYAIRREVFDNYAPATAPPVHPKFQGLEAPCEPCGVRHSTPYRYHEACNVYVSANGDLVCISPNSRKLHYKIVDSAGKTWRKAITPFPLSSLHLHCWALGEKPGENRPPSHEQRTDPRS